jgi:hypothetical protein
MRPPIDFGQNRGTFGDRLFVGQLMKSPTLRFMKTLRPLLTAISFFGAVCSAEATTVIPPTFDELVREAELIFQGTVTNVESQWAGEGGQRHIVSYITIQVEDALKGTPGASYTIRMLGGTVGDETMEVSDSPKFKVGDREILFVENNGRQFIPLVGIMYGRFRVQKDQRTGADVVLNNEGKPVGDLAQLGKNDLHAPVTSTAPLDLAAFKSAIRAKVDSQ